MYANFKEFCGSKDSRDDTPGASHLESYGWLLIDSKPMVAASKRLKIYESVDPTNTQFINFRNGLPFVIILVIQVWRILWSNSSSKLVDVVPR
jgi:hypothetical protein